jgi:hypothetical protein
MTRGRTLFFLGCLLMSACGAGLSHLNSVTAHADEVQASEGYEVSVATAEAQGYRVAAKDPNTFHVRLWAKPTGVGSRSMSTIELQARPGAVEISVPELPGRPRADAERRELRRQMQQLAWDIGNRAAILRGRPLGPATPSSPDPLPPSFAP